MSASRCGWFRVRAAQVWQEARVGEGAVVIGGVRFGSFGSSVVEFVGRLTGALKPLLGRVWEVVGSR